MALKNNILIKGNFFYEFILEYQLLHTILQKKKKKHKSTILHLVHLY